MGLSLILIQNFQQFDNSLESTESFKPWTIFKAIKLALDVEHPVVKAEAARALFDFVLVVHNDAVDFAVDSLLLDSDDTSDDKNEDTGKYWTLQKWPFGLSRGSLCAVANLVF